MKKVIPINSLKEDLEMGLCTTQIAEKYDCHTCTVIRTCKRNQLPYPKRNSNPIVYRGKHFDTGFFHVIDSEAKAYILGFISADGGLDRGWGCKIKLNPKDSDILVKIATAMKCDYKPVLIEKDTRISLTLYSVELVKDLAQYGVIRNKTKTLPFAVNVPEEFVLDYMRGMFDGDGSFGDKRRTAKFVCGSIPFSEGFLSWYKSKYGTEPWHQIEDGTKYRFSFNLKDVPFIKGMYDNASISLDRKQALYEKWYKNLQ